MIGLYPRLCVTEDIDKASFTPAPSFLRRMTPAEAAIIQTFPLEYKFCGTQSKIYTQIGNAVPCNLAKAVVSMVVDVLNGKRNLVLKNTQQEILFE